MAYTTRCARFSGVPAESVASFIVQLVSRVDNHVVPVSVRLARLVEPVAESVVRLAVLFAVSVAKLVEPDMVNERRL